ncbi:hypothetical protein OOU_Y34scaffold00211g23 [Pyricularia oryzae Y34]|uniref:Uncharacterized protein n=2 Tax=Pyricularia oryzae TaxID=318829 RepID=A0AA97PPL4_PYRO3|nr:hypothetical protein OOU_Y34scaffold00211g23 [Pyricularia oryzae Y34]
MWYRDVDCVLGRGLLFAFAVHPSGVFGLLAD